MAINFPNSPSNGATHTVGNITYVYDSSKGLWKDSPAGLTQGIDALTDVDISTAAPTNGQILEYNSSSGKFVPADSSAGVTVYATINDLPLTGVAEGSMALVDSTDKLYIFSDTGWYSIAIVNTSPSISGVNASYTLAMDGTALTISVTASDPEGVPITYSIVSDTSGNIATVAQGTGSNTNQWTITPSTNTAHAGNFTLVFRASDGTNVASASSTFTLAFAHIDSNHTTMLLTSVGANNGVNNSYTDSSASAHTITRNGDTNQVTFSPYRHGGYSAYFDGTGDYLGAGGSSNNESLSGNFCIEAWIYPTGTNDGTILGNYLSGPNRGWSMRSYTSNNLYLYFQISGGSQIVYQTASNTVNPKEWNHVVWCRDGTDTSVFINGTRADNRTLSGTAAGAGGVAVSSLSQGFVGYHFTGYITDARIVNGSAVYDPSQTTLTVPTERLTAVTNTSLLTCHLPYIADGSTNNHSITVNGDVKTEPWSPYDNAGYAASDHGGSAYFDGTGDYLSIPVDNGFEFGTGDFTIEMWFRYIGTIARYPIILGNGISGSGIYSGWAVYTAGNVLKLDRYTGSQTTVTFGSFTAAADTWHHLAIARSGTTIRGFINGTQVGSDITNSVSYNAHNTDPLNIGYGVDGAGTHQWNGNMSDIRIVKGTAVYTGNFTPPTAPLTQTGGTYPSTTNVNTSITSGHTKLLLPCDDASIIDKSQSIRDIRVLGAFASSNTQTKFGSTSIKYNGSDARAFLRSGDLFNLGTGEFTVECWLYKDATGAGIILDARPSNSGAPWYLGVDYQEKPFFYDGSSYTSTTALSANTWTHIAVTRDSSNVLRIFLDGTVEHTTNSYTTNLTATDQTVTGVRSGYPGDYLSGYIEDLRVTKGKARYTANFTAPTAALEG